MIAGTTGALAIEAGADILAQGGSAMDAALATAMVQIVLCGGSWVSFAGILNAVYYDAASGTVHNLNGAYNTVRGETDPLSIPALPMNNIMGSEIFPSGRATLVPGFMRAAEAGHRRFGKLPFPAVLAPAIRLAEEGFLYTASDVQWVTWRKNVLSRRPETQAVFTRPDGSWHRVGDRFCQPALAQTLRRVAERGVDHMYTGEWAQRFVTAVRSEGGQMTMEDLAAYQALWCDPIVSTYHDCTVYGHGLPAVGGINTAEALNLFEAADLKRLGHYSRSPEALFWQAQICRLGLMANRSCTAWAISFSICG
jgi:gamma-glutamyltranspeptidase/glutathione hydrolase